jgi:hypothetical protein
VVNILNYAFRLMQFNTYNYWQVNASAPIIYFVNVKKHHVKLEPDLTKLVLPKTGVYIYTVNLCAYEYYL